MNDNKLLTHVFHTYSATLCDTQSTKSDEPREPILWEDAESLFCIASCQPACLHTATTLPAPVATTSVATTAKELFNAPQCKFVPSNIGKVYAGPVVIQAQKTIEDPVNLVELTDRASTEFHIACQELCRADLRSTYWPVYP